MEKSEYTPDKLVARIDEDLRDRSDWATAQRRAKELRLNEDAARRAPYPGAPDLREPLIDDSVTHLAAAEMSIVWSVRTLATFLPSNPQGHGFKRACEEAFDLYLRRTIQVRGVIESILDTKNERGIGFGWVTIGRTDDDGNPLPTIESVEPTWVILPSRTKRVRDAERLTRVHLFTEIEFRQEGERRGWKNVDALVTAHKSEDTPDTEDVIPAELFGKQELTGHGPSFVVYEHYHYRKDAAGKLRKWVTWFCPYHKDLPLREYAWRWPDSVAVLPDGQTQVIEGKDRPWPCVEFRFEHRSGYLHDTRGIGKKLEKDQAYASANMTAKGIAMDYTCRPFVRGVANLAGFRWRPGDTLPQGAELVPPAGVDNIFDYNVDLTRAAAARRVGAPYGALSSMDRTKATKTATEVQHESLQSNLQSSNSVDRFAEPLSDLFTQVWEILAKNGVPLRGADSSGMLYDLPLEAYQEQYVILASISGKHANVDTVMRQLDVVARLVQAFPAVQQFIRGGELARMIFEWIDPRMAPRLVVETSTGAPQAPIEQQVAMMGQQVAAQGQYLAAIAQEEASVQDQAQDVGPVRYDNPAGGNSAGVMG